MEKGDKMAKRFEAGSQNEISVLKFRLKPKLKLKRIVDHHLHVDTVF